MRRAGGRIFHSTGDGLWEDGAARGQAARLVIRVYSDAYFELLELRPDLREALGLAEKIRVRLGSDVLEIGESGADAIPRRDRDWLESAR
jgi:hypothetical protein